MISSRLVGLQGRRAQALWAGAGMWAVLCGALASGGPRYPVGSLVLVLLLAELGWGSLWDLAVNSGWLRALAAGRRPEGAAGLRLPYTQPGSPAGRLFRGLGRAAAWWREVFWPAAGGALLGSAAAAALVLALGLVLPDALHLLNAALAALIGLGLWQRWRGRAPLLGEATVQVGLGWLAGHTVVGPLSAASLVLALSFLASVWGAKRLKEGLRGALWLLDGGQVVVVALLAALKQPLPAFAAGMLLLGQAALQPGLAAGGDRSRVLAWTWPWLTLNMLIAALAVP